MVEANSMKFSFEVRCYTIFSVKMSHNTFTENTKKNKIKDLHGTLILALQLVSDFSEKNTFME